MGQLRDNAYIIAVIEHLGEWMLAKSGLLIIRYHM